MDSFSVRNDFKYSTFSEILTFYSPFTSKYSIDLIVLKREGLLIIVFPCLDFPSTVKTVMNCLLK